MNKVSITPAMIKELRDRTGVGMGKCKAALEEASGDLNLAIDNLRKQGMAQAVKKEGRETKEGVIKTFLDDTGIALVEVNAETDFVVKNENFQTFASQMAEEVAHATPTSVEDFLKHSSKTQSGKTIDELRVEAVQKLGENIQMKRVEFFPKKDNASLGVYSHMGGKILTLVEITGSSDAQALAKEIAMHTAAEAPEYVSSEEVPPRVIEHEKEIARAQIQNKPPQVQEKILEGKLNSYFDQVCLVRQKFVKDPSMTIEQLVAAKGKEMNAPLKISQFLRWKIGE